MKSTQSNMKHWASLQEKLGRSRQNFKQYELFNNAPGLISAVLTGAFCITSKLISKSAVFRYLDL